MKQDRLIPTRTARVASKFFRRLHFLPVALIVLFLVTTGSASATPIKFLPDATELPKGTQEIQPEDTRNDVIRTYVGGKVHYEQDVECPVAGCNFPAGTKIGSLQFDYAAYTGIRETDPAAGPDTIGGAAIRGGFIFDDTEDFKLKDGYKFRWLQVFREIVPGQPDNKEVDGDPFYPDFTKTGIDAFLYDVPFDLLTRDITLVFESALVCVECSDMNNVKYIGSFLWGYSINNGVVTANSPSNWGAPTQSFIDTVEDAFPAIDLEAGCCVEIPEPASLWLMPAGLIVLILVRMYPAMHRKSI